MRFIKGLFILFVILGVLAAAAGYFGWNWVQTEWTRPGPSSEELVFKVERGEGLIAVANRLESEGYIRNARVLRIGAQMNDASTLIKPGQYRLPAAQSLRDTLSQLVERDVIQYRVTIPEGRTSAQILKILEENDKLTGELPEEPPAEGTLLPDTYFFEENATRQDILDRMAAARDSLLEQLWGARAEDIPVKTPEEAIVLASVVEKETGLAEERPQVAAVFTNRLRRGMRLESDPTIIYGISRGEPLFNRRGQRRTLYRSEIDRVTPWNTYQIDGLPQTPICNPGRDAIAAVLNPPDSPYIFFVADGTGGHAFASTLAQHNRNVAAYRRIEAERIAEERAN